ncbi:MAG: cupin domain-containing protein [Pseudomonadota bacterium]
MSNHPNVFRAAAGPLHAVRPDLPGTVIAGRDVTLVRWEIDPRRAATGLHAHPDHEQFTVVVSGQVETHVDGKPVVLGPGDVCRLAPGSSHGATRALGDEVAILVDVFSPPRQDYLAAAFQER